MTGFACAEAPSLEELLGRPAAAADSLLFPFDGGVRPSKPAFAVSGGVGGAHPGERPAVPGLRMQSGLAAGSGMPLILCHLGVQAAQRKRCARSRGCRWPHCPAFMACTQTAASFW